MDQVEPIYFEDVDLGDELGPLEKNPTSDVVEAFCDLWDHPRPNRFVDATTAREVGQPGPIVPGIMSVALMSQLFTSWGGPEVLKKIDVVFRQPVLHRPVKITALVIDKREEKGEHLIECDVYLTNLEGDRLVGGKVIAALPSKGR